MKKRIVDQTVTKAAKREQKKRPRMKMHGRSLLMPSKHAGKKLSSR